MNIHQCLSVHIDFDIYSLFLNKISLIKNYFHRFWVSHLCKGFVRSFTRLFGKCKNSRPWSLSRNTASWIGYINLSVRNIHSLRFTREKYAVNNGYLLRSIHSQFMIIYFVYLQVKIYLWKPWKNYSIIK